MNPKDVYFAGIYIGQLLTADEQIAALPKPKPFAFVITKNEASNRYFSFASENAEMRKWAMNLLAPYAFTTGLSRDVSVEVRETYKKTDIVEYFIKAAQIKCGGENTLIKR